MFDMQNLLSNQKLVRLKMYGMDAKILNSSDNDITLGYMLYLSYSKHNQC